jgi:hypothetical protein
LCASFSRAGACATGRIAPDRPTSPKYTGERGGLPAESLRHIADLVAGVAGAGGGRIGRRNRDTETGFAQVPRGLVMRFPEDCFRKSHHSSGS